MHESASATIDEETKDETVNPIANDTTLTPQIVEKLLLNLNEYSVKLTQYLCEDLDTSPLAIASLANNLDKKPTEIIEALPSGAILNSERIATPVCIAERPSSGRIGLEPMGMEFSVRRPGRQKISCSQLTETTIIGANPYSLGIGFHPSHEEYMKQIEATETK